MSSPTASRYPERNQEVDSPLSPTGRQPSFHHDLRQFDRRSSMRRSSLTSITSSIGGTLDTASQNTAEFNDLSQNAISSLLSHPIVRTGLVPQSALSVPPGHRAPNVRDIPPVNLTPIPHVDASAFQPYLSTVGPLYDTYHRSKTPTEENSPRKREQAQHDYFSSPRPSSRSDSISSFGTPSLKMPSLLSPPESPSTSRRPSTAAGARRSRHGPTPLSTIPNVYFEENFQLENPRTFDVVSERSDVIPPDPSESNAEAKAANGSAKAPAKTGRRALHTNAILQEKLSWYMDTVEVHLIQSIASASSSFFAALGSLKELETEATQSIDQIKSLRGALKSLNKEMALGGLEVVKMRRRRENLQKLANAAKQLCDVMEEAKKCEEMVDQGLLGDANSRLDALEGLIAGTAMENVDRPPRVDLRPLKALGGLNDGISQLRQRIGRGYETRFIEALLADLRQHVESVPPKETMQRWARATLRTRGDHTTAPSTMPAYLRPNESLRSELLAALAGLNRVGQARNAASAYREATMREIKSMIRKYLPSSSDEDAESTTSVSTRGGRRLNQQEKSAVLARNLRALDAESFEELLVKVYTSVGEALRRMGTQVKVVLDVTSTVEQPTGPKPQGSQPSGVPSVQINQMRDEVTQLLDMSSLLGQAVDTMQGQVTKVLRVRGEQNARAPLEQFLRFFMLNRLFTDECEAVSGRGGEGLKEIINSQVKDFVSVTSDNLRQQIVTTLQADQWDAQDFGSSHQTQLNRILESMDRTPKAWQSYTALWEDEPSKNGTTIANGDAEPAAKARSAKIEEQSYMLVHSTISAVSDISTHLNLIAIIPSLTADCTLKLLEYVKAFNSLCTQLILGAGATRSAGLKNITTKHLALASQTCSFLIALVPYMRESVRRQAGSSAGSVLPEFDKVKRAIQDHKSSIHEKLVDIMSQRSALHVNSMKKVDWEAPGASEVNQYMETLAKETSTLHRVLARHVADIDLQMIMVPIFGHYSQEWTKAFEDAAVKTEGGRQRMLRDLAYLDTKFAKIDSAGDFVKNLTSIVKSKKVQKAAQESILKESSKSSPAMQEPAKSSPATEETTTQDSAKNTLAASESDASATANGADTGNAMNAGPSAPATTGIGEKKIVSAETTATEETAEEPKAVEPEAEDEVQIPEPDESAEGATVFFEADETENPTEEEEGKARGEEEV